MATKATAAKTKKVSKKATEVKTVEQLQKDLTAKLADMLAAKRSHAAGELVNHRVLTTTRKEIARLHTAVRAAELAGKESN